MPDMTYRDLRPSDLPDMSAIVSDWQIVRQLGSWPWPPVDTFAASRCKPCAGEGFVWAICDADRLIGTMAVTGSELGYNLLRHHRRQGIASVAAELALTRAFDLGRDVIKASVWHDNAASARLLRKFRFVHCRTDYANAKARRIPTLLYHFRLTRTDWDRLRTASQ